VLIGYLLFLLTGFVFGYSAPKAWALIPVLLPILIGVYTGLMDVFDTALFVKILVGVGITLLGIVLGRALVYSLEGGSRSSRTA
jgi:hypothetical protein